MAKKRAELWVLWVPASKKPVIPWDCNPGHNDEGMLVYSSHDAAMSAATHQRELYGVECEPRRLSEVCNG